MSLAALSGWRTPHEPLVEIAEFQLPGGVHSISVGGAGESCGWRAINFNQGGVIDRWTNSDETLAHAWVYPRAVAQSAVGPTDILYADMPALEFRIRATVVAGSPPSSGGTDVWRDLTTEQPTWWVNSGGSPGEVGTSTVLLEIAQYLPGEGEGPVLASGQYTMTITRT